MKIRERPHYLGIEEIYYPQRQCSHCKCFIPEGSACIIELDNHYVLCEKHMAVRHKDIPEDGAWVATEMGKDEPYLCVRDKRLIDNYL